MLDYEASCVSIYPFPYLLLLNVTNDTDAAKKILQINGMKYLVSISIVMRCVYVRLYVYVLLITGQISN